MKGNKRITRLEARRCALAMGQKWHEAAIAVELTTAASKMATGGTVEVRQTGSGVIVRHIRQGEIVVLRIEGVDVQDRLTELGCKHHALNAVLVAHALAAVSAARGGMTVTLKEMAVAV